jgi:hypothetical protein
LEPHLPKDVVVGFRRIARLLDRRSESRRGGGVTRHRQRGGSWTRSHTGEKFYKYAMWRDHARKLPATAFAARGAAPTTPRRVGELPFRMAHYEDYRDRFNETVSHLVELLEREVVEPPSVETFRPSPSYDDYYYLPDQVEAIRDLIHHLVSDELWRTLHRYF